MTESLADIEALILRCKSEQSKEYIAEAVLCYRSGAYRAAIVSIWIAVVFDLVDKIRELALSGDGNAQTLKEQYERYLNQIEQGTKPLCTGSAEVSQGLKVLLLKDELVLLPIIRITVVFQVLLHHLIGDIACTPGAVTDGPEMAAPIALF